MSVSLNRFNRIHLNIINVLTTVITNIKIGIFDYSNVFIMATATFRLRNDTTNNATISVYLTVKRGKQFLVSTDLSINPKDWSVKKNNENKPNRSLTGFPKNIGDEHIKNLRTNLKSLETHLLKEINTANANGTIINSNWVKEQINICFDRQTDNDIQKEIESTESNRLTVQTQNFINDATTYIHKNGKVGLSTGRVRVLKNFKRIISDYETETKTVVYLKEIDFAFEKKFNNWLLNIKEYSTNYGGSMIKDIKVVGNYANKKGIEVNRHVDFMQKYKQQKTDKIIQTLSIDELNEIENWSTENERLNNARKWIILGCNIGQRGADLLDITLKNFVTLNGKKYIQLTQSKTSKEVLIPITKQCERVLQTGIPYKISKEKLNEYIKEVCQLVKIDEVVLGDLFDKETKRKKRGNYPKYKLISLHSFRRSYATNYYIDIPTPIIMEITAHSEESTFLEYINKPVDKTRNANLMLELIELAEQKKASKKETPVIEINKAN